MACKLQEPINYPLRGHNTIKPDNKTTVNQTTCAKYSPGTDGQGITVGIHNNWSANRGKHPPPTSMIAFNNALFGAARNWQPGQVGKVVAPVALTRFRASEFGRVTLANRAVISAQTLVSYKQGFAAHAIKIFKRDTERPLTCQVEWVFFPIIILKASVAFSIGNVKLFPA